jgi:sRNA-binding protein
VTRLSRRRRSAQARKIIAVLGAFWPGAFAVYEQRRRPLKNGIHHDLVRATAGAINHAEIELALQHYISNIACLRACYADADRIDLYGKIVGRVTEYKAADAAAKLV